MPDMYEIYRKHAGRYDELVQSEDFENNLGNFLKSTVDWHNLRVLEAGVGTGRVTRLYLDEIAFATCCDRSEHMLQYARNALSIYSKKLTFLIAENTNLPETDQPIDVFIEGWSFGHAIMDCLSIEELHRVTRILVSNSVKNLKPGGTIIFIETLGTNTDTPAPPHEKLQSFYNELETHYGFLRNSLRTDYRFETVGKAAQVLGFFFGEEMERSILAHNHPIIPEWTGIWTMKPNEKDWKLLTGRSFSSRL